MLQDPGLSLLGIFRILAGTHLFLSLTLIAGCVFSGRPLARGNWNAFQWSPTGGVEMNLTIL